MAYTTINKHTDHFNTKLYTGNGSTQSITGVGFQPDLIWLKNRSQYSHFWHDVLRGVTKEIYSDSDSSEGTRANGLTAFDSDGFTVGNNNGHNANSETFASWNWKAGGSGSANSNGATASTVSANTTAGFSIVKWTGTGSATTVGHGLGAAPTMIWVKNLADANDWFVYSKAWGYLMSNPDPETDYLKLNQINGRADDASAWNDTAPTATVFSVGNASNSNGSSDPMIAYCFRDIPGYSKIGAYSGNNSSSGVFVYTGFKPAFIIFKRTDANADWRVYDNKRYGNSVNDKFYYLEPNTTDAEGTTDSGGNWDMLSNGFRFYTSESEINGGGDYMYYAVGQSLVGTNNVPCTAR